MKPDWMKEHENPRSELLRLKRCNTCIHPGEPCGYTRNYGKGRMVMYRCRLHPTIKVYLGMLACEDHTYGDNGIDW